MDEGWANVSELLSDSERGIERRQALDAAVALQNYQFNCHGVEHGQISDWSGWSPDRYVAWQAQRNTANGVDDLHATLMPILSRQQISSAEVARKAA